MKSRKFYDDRLKALNDCIIVQPLKQQTKAELEEGDEFKKTNGGLFIPDVAKKTILRDKMRDYKLYATGLVVSSGRGRISGGKVIHNQCSKGDLIYYRDGGYVVIQVEEIEYHLLNEDNVMVIVAYTQEEKEEFFKKYWVDHPEEYSELLESKLNATD